MDAILIYNKETGIVEGATNLESIDIFLSGCLTPVNVTAKTFDSEGNEIGTSEVHLFDPDFGFLWTKNPFPLDTKGLVYLTSRTEEEIKNEEIPDIFYPEHTIPVILNGTLTESTYVLQRRITIIKEVDSSGKILETQKKRKRILEENYSDLIFNFSLEEFPENDSEIIQKILNEYKVEVDSTTNTKRLVARG